MLSSDFVVTLQVFLFRLRCPSWVTRAATFVWRALATCGAPIVLCLACGLEACRFIGGCCQRCCDVCRKQPAACPKPSVQTAPKAVPEDISLEPQIRPSTSGFRREKAEDDVLQPGDSALFRFKPYRPQRPLPSVPDVHPSVRGPQDDSQPKPSAPPESE